MWLTQPVLPSDLLNLLRTLPVDVPRSSLTVEKRFRLRLSQALGNTGDTVDELKQHLLGEGIFDDTSKDKTVLDQDQLESLAFAISAHATPICRPESLPEDLEGLSNHSVFEIKLGAMLQTPDPIHAKEHHVDSLEAAARLLRAEELLGEIDALISPILNDRDERRSFANYLSQSKKRFAKLWPTEREEVGENAHTPRRAEWMQCLVDLVREHWERAAVVNETEAPSKQQVADVSVYIAKLLGIKKPTSADGLLRR